MNVNNMNLIIHKSWYNKSRVGDDGITHSIDTSKQYPVYLFQAQKHYFAENQIDVLDNIILDLHEVIKQLEQIRDHAKEQEIDF